MVLSIIQHEYSLKVDFVLYFKKKKSAMNSQNLFFLALTSSRKTITQSLNFQSRLHRAVWPVTGSSPQPWEQDRPGLQEGTRGGSDLHKNSGVNTVVFKSLFGNVSFNSGIRGLKVNGEKYNKD